MALVDLTKRPFDIPRSEVQPPPPDLSDFTKEAVEEFQQKCVKPYRQAYENRIIGFQIGSGVIAGIFTAIPLVASAANPVMAIHFVPAFMMWGIWLLSLLAESVLRAMRESK